MRAIQKYEQREVPFAAWILRVARNAALDHVRSSRMIPVEEVRTTDDGYEDVASSRYQSLKTALERTSRSATRGAGAATHRRALADRDRRATGKRPRCLSRDCTTAGARR